MGEIDTKSIEPVQASLSLFGGRSEKRGNGSTSSDEFEKDKELEDLLKDLSNYKVQLEAKDTAYKQTLLNLDHYQKLAEELSTLLKNSDFQKDIYISECREGRVRIEELESKMKEMADQLSETMKIHEQLSIVMSELKITQAELESLETELAASRAAKLEALTQTELMETELEMEKEKTEELLRIVSGLNEAILHSRMASIEAEKERCAILSEKEADIELATKKALEAEEKLEYVSKELGVMQDLENQLMAKSVIIDSLQVELQQANELHSLSEKAAADAISELNELKSDFELKEKKNKDQLGYIELLEMEQNQLKLELENTKEKVQGLNAEADNMIGELEKVKTEMEEIRERETEAQVEIAMLKSELHKGRLRIAAAEAVEARAKSEKSGLYLAVQQLAMEADEAKKENQRLKEAAGKEAEGSENSLIVDPQDDNSSEKEEQLQISESEAEDEDGDDDTKLSFVLSEEEYRALIDKAKKAEQVLGPVPENTYELENLKKELESATVKIGEFRTRAEQAMSRAEAAEKAKAALEDQMRAWREQREKRKAALAALREESFSQEISSFKYDDPTPKTYQPLAKILNMKF